MFKASIATRRLGFFFLFVANIISCSYVVSMGRRCGPHRRRHRARGRPIKFGLVLSAQVSAVYIPVIDSSDVYPDALELCPEELEAMKLAHIDGLTVEQIATKLGVSTSTAWRILESGRKKVVEALVKLKPIRIALP